MTDDKKPEPVARMLIWKGNGTYPKRGYTIARTYKECPENAYPDDWEEGDKLCTAQPAREWVGLTEDDISHIMLDLTPEKQGTRRLVRIIESALKTKNT